MQQRTKLKQIVKLLAGITVVCLIAIVATLHIRLLDRSPLYPNDAIINLLKEQQLKPIEINEDLVVEMRVSPSADTERIQLVKLGMPLIGYKLSTVSETKNDNYVGVVVVVLNKSKASSQDFKNKITGLANYYQIADSVPENEASSDADVLMILGRRP